MESLTREQAVDLAGKDPDCNRRDLFDAIARGDFPSWTVYVQIMTPEQARKYRFNPFDATKVWFHRDFPLIRVGKMVLNRNPENFFAEVEQAAFAPSTLVPGIYPSPDKLLQGRLFAYEDAHRYRLGKNHDLIPVNSPKGTSAYTNERDGAMMTGSNYGSTANYFPNSVNGYREAKDIPDVPALALKEATIARHDLETTEDDYFQAGELYRRVLSDTDRDHLISNIASHLGGALKRIQYRQAALFYNADADYGMRVADALNLYKGRVEILASLSDEVRAVETSEDL